MHRMVLLLMLILFVFTGAAQDYRGSVGLRGGVTQGITYKIMLFDEQAFEGVFSFRHNGIQLTGLSLNHQPVLFNISDKLFLYKGFGAHVGYYGRCRGRRKRNDNCEHQRYFSPVLGIDGIVGLEYRFIDIPLSAAIDYKPFIDIFGTNFFSSNFYDFAFSAKYTF